MLIGRRQTMDLKTGVLVCALLVGCFALPKPAENLSKYFNPRDTRIVGGTQAAEGSHPHMAALHSGILISTFICGGAVVARRSILTAAHCVRYGSPGVLLMSLRVTVGTNRWRTGGHTYRLSHDVTHPEYDEGELRHDLALLITDTDIEYSRLVQPVPLSFDFIPEGVEARTAGWGSTTYSSPLSPTLQELETTVVDVDTCVKLAADAAPNFPDWYIPAVEPELHICTLHSVGHGVCNSDSGSALVRIETGEHIGLVTWGFRCATGEPDIFVRTSSYKDFLTANLV